jgi:hypothetical protein
MALTYEWFLDDITTGVTTAQYDGTASAVPIVSEVFCNVTNEAGTTKSDVVILTVVDLPVITAQPVNLTVGVGDPYTFSVTATG